ncbi:PfkB domain protein [Paenibacillus curdlanolyticus YK9]|uniref:PfkB domain protein n=1 Tax=Paenibacillus curdlanolyticus YK9 TaxID=717606 RepID=E0IAS1_9BACL|nr:sugar kinase [Paenibacillus curdlanolyticus]EFM10475.1 PfkB domain protein [Paenibacillus curdlanolyticus YK9]
MSPQQPEQPKQPYVVTFGESMGLLTAPSAKGIEYAHGLELSFGGAETNVAIGLARLGIRVGWFGRLGSDPIGRSILTRVRGEGVDVSRAAQDGERPTGLMLREQTSGRTSVYYYRKLSAMSAMQPSELDEAYIAGASMLHVTGIMPALSDSCKETVFEAVRIARRNGVKVCFDPNLRLKLWSLSDARETLLALAQQADYFLPGMDELMLLYEMEDAEQIMDRLRQLDAVSVVKGSRTETLLLENGQLQRIPCFPVERVTDAVGAGDGFCAGFIAGLLKGHSTAEAVRLGNLIGSLVVQAEGDWEGLPTWSHAEAVLLDKRHVER